MKICGSGSPVIAAPTIIGASKPKRLPINPERLQAPNLSAARAFAFIVSSSRFRDGALVSSEWRRRLDVAATSSTAAMNGAWLAFEGLLKPLIFLTNWSEAARISSAETGGSKLKRILILLHIFYPSRSSEFHTLRAKH